MRRLLGKLLGRCDLLSLFVLELEQYGDGVGVLRVGLFGVGDKTR